MPSFSGRYKYLDAGGSPLQEGTCRLSFTDQDLTLTPSSGAPLACDLADIDVFSPGDYELSLKLYTGKTILLTHFAKDFQNLAHDLLEAWKERIVHCLLLEDLEEVARYDGCAQLDSPDARFSGKAEIRLYRSNLAVLPENAAGISWRLADIDNVDFDEPTYTLGVRSGRDRLILTRMAKRTREFIDKLQQGLTDISEKSVSTLHGLFPFLGPDQTIRAAELMKEGRAVPIAQLNAIDQKTEPALLKNAVDKSLRPYFEALKTMTVSDGYFAGFKFIRPEAQDAEPEGPPETPEPEAEQNPAAEPPADEPMEEEGGEEAQPSLHWFFFPLKAPATGAPSNVVAWEASSRGGRATYFFRILPEDQKARLNDRAQFFAAVQEAVGQINRALVLLNFRREPVYLPDDSLATQPRYHRHAIAARKIASLRRLRAAYMGRALHTGLDAWKKQVATILEKS